MFATSVAPIELIDKPDLPPERQNVIVMRRRLTMEQAAALHREQMDLREHFGGTITILQLEPLLLKFYIADWRGPAFGGAPCTPANIAQLYADEPLVERARQTAYTIYVGGALDGDPDEHDDEDDDPNPQSPTPPGSDSSGDTETGAPASAAA